MDAVEINKRYRLEDEIGSGGMGVVYRAVDRLSGQKVALKRVTQPTEKLMFTSVSDSMDIRLALAREFQTLASLRHPNIISVLDYGFDHERQPFFTMDLLENAPIITQYGADLSLEDRIKLLVDVLQALKYLHRRGILHRDLKPANILVTADKSMSGYKSMSGDNGVSGGQVKVLDFGLAISHRESAEHTSTTSGTLGYMAPEVLLGHPATEASDLYALGMIAYEMLAGQHPFRVENVGELVNDVLHVVPDATTLGNGLKVGPVIQRLLSKSPEDRYQSVEEVSDAFNQAIGRTIVSETKAIRESFLQASRLIGRQDELAKLADILNKAAENHQGGLWLIGGESGIGKSRLVNELRTQALVRGVPALRGQEVNEGGSTYQPWREIMRWLVLLTDISDAEAGVLKTIIPDIGTLLNREVTDAPEIPPQAAQGRLIGTMTAIFQRFQQPLLVVLEDIHWSSASLDVLKQLIPLLSKLPLLIVATYRDDERPDLPKTLAGANVLKLERLNSQSIAELSQSMIGTVGARPELVDLLQRETEGNIFFVVEVVRALAEDAGQLERIGVQTLPQHVFAGGIQQVVQRRLSRVPAEDYPLLQQAAVMGRKIDEAALKAASPQTDLQRWLVDCSNAAVLSVSDAVWSFSHDKLRDGVLSKLTEDQQKTLHRRAAEALEAVYPDVPEKAASLALHWHMAGEPEKERRYAIRAGQLAHRNGAILEAVKQFRRAIELLMLLPESPERIATELELQLNLGVNLLAAESYGSQQVFETYERARLLCQQIGQTPQLFRVLSGLNVYYVLRAKVSTAREIAEQSVKLADMAGDSGLHLEAYRMMAASTFWAGKLEEARYYMDKTVEVYQPDNHRTNILTYGQDSAVACLANGGWLRWFQGYPDQAVETVNKGIRLAESVNHAFSLCFVLAFAGRLYLCLHDLAGLQETSARLMKVATENDIKSYVVNAMTDIGWLKCAQGNYDESLAQLQQSLNIFRMVGSELTTPYVATLLAEQYGNAGKVDEGRKLIDETLQALNTTNESHAFKAEAHRVKGELLLKMNDQEQAVACFREALAVARSQKARALELRAAMSLVRTLGSPAKQDLSDVYETYSEGLDTFDLKQARELLGKTV